MAEQALLPAYLAVGTDEVKRDTAVARLKERLARTGMADFNLDERDMTREQDLDAILSSLNTYPMGADFRLVILEGCDRLAEPVREALVTYLANPAETTCLLMTAGSLAKSTRLYKAVAKLGKQAIIDCGAKKGRDLPVLVQGMARTADGGFALSTSYGRNTDSHLLYYTDVTAHEPAYYLTVPGGEVPVYALTKDTQTQSLRLPPLLEGVDMKDGAVTGIFESGAQKYSDGKFPLNQICAF